MVSILPILGHAQYPFIQLHTGSSIHQIIPLPRNISSPVIKRNMLFHRAQCPSSTICPHIRPDSACWRSDLRECPSKEPTSLLGVPFYWTGVTGGVSAEMINEPQLCQRTHAVTTHSHERSAAIYN